MASCCSYNTHTLLYGFGFGWMLEIIIMMSLRSGKNTLKRFLMFSFQYFLQFRLEFVCIEGDARGSCSIYSLNNKLIISPFIMFEIVL